MKNPHYNEQFYEEVNGFSDSNLIFDPDFDKNRPNPVEEQYTNIILFSDNFKDIQPKNDEALRIAIILSKPHFESITNDQKFLIWKYRYFLSKRKDALPKFLHSVNWAYEKEGKEALNLMAKWDPIDYEDALHLISSEFCANDVYNKYSFYYEFDVFRNKPLSMMLAVRSYAIGVLKAVPDVTISKFLSSYSKNKTF
jgi:hypothetical protein